MFNEFAVGLVCHSHLCTEQLINISAVSRLRGSAEISAVQVHKSEWHSRCGLTRQDYNYPIFN